MPNAFCLFMLDYKKKEEGKGRKFPNGLDDVRRDPKCNEIWQGMTAQEKGQYKAQAKAAKYGAKPQGKLTCTGESVLQLERIEKERLKYEQTMANYITLMTQPHNSTTSKFFFIHVNFFYMKQLTAETFDYCPAEFAVAEFSLEDGVGDVYHEILNVDVPIGFTLEAMETSQNSHQIPLKLTDGENDFYAMYYKLESFVLSKVGGSKLPPFFTKPIVKGKVQSLFQRMANAADVDIDTLYVYSLDVLFNQLINDAYTRTAKVVNIPLPVAQKQLDVDRFAYTPGLECAFHHCLDAAIVHCSMSVVKRWGFTICDHCCQSMKIEMIPGKHFPAKKDIGDAELERSLAELSLNVAPTPTVLSMTGVSTDYRTRTSQRTYEQERARRNMSAPIEVIDHSKVHKTPEIYSVANPVCERPLRTPKTKSIAMTGMQEGVKQMDDAAFPPIGRSGSSRSNKVPNPKSSVGRGRGWF